MLASTLRQKVQLQEKSIVQSPLGQSVIWKPVSDHFARVVLLDVRAVARYQQLDTVASHKILLRGTVEVNLGDHRLLHRFKIYEPQQSAKHYDEVTEVIALEV